jgi:hypothetical protein
MLASHLALPCRGHLLEAVLAVYAFLKNKHNSTMLVFDPTTFLTIDEADFIWSATGRTTIQKPRNKSP